MSVCGWSHTEEAYAAAERNLRKLPVRDLVDIYAEWREVQLQQQEDVPFDWEKHKKEARRLVRQAGKDALADLLWEWASEQALCDRGGYSAWVCPEGCHTVRFR